MFLEAWSSLLAIDLCLRVLPFRWAWSLFEPAPRSRSVPDRAERAARCAWAVGAAARRHLWPMRCLARSFCLRGLLGRRGLEGVLRIGVARQDDRLCAHAWIEWEGRPLGETEAVAARFEPLLQTGEIRRAAGRLSG